MTGSEAVREALASVMDVVGELAAGLAHGQRPGVEWAAVVTETFNVHRTAMVEGFANDVRAATPPPATEDGQRVTSYPVDVVGVGRFFSDDHGPTIAVRFRQEGGADVSFALTEPLAWIMASQVLHVLDRAAASPEELHDLENPSGDE